MKKLLLSLLFIPVLLFSQVRITSNTKTTNSYGELSQERIVYQNCKVNWSKSTWSRGSAVYIYEAPSSKFVRVDFLVENLQCGVFISWNPVNESQKMSEDESQEYIFIKKVTIKIKYGQHTLSTLGTVYDYSAGDSKYYVVSFGNRSNKEAIFIINLTKFE
jgi:hypothetical protein